MYGTSGNSEENSNGTVHPLEMFSAKKVIPSEVSDFPLLPERPKFLEPFAWITSARLSLERRTKIYLYFVNDTTQSCFRCENNTSSIWRTIFTEISVQMVIDESDPSLKVYFFLRNFLQLNPTENFRQFWLNKLNKCAPMRRRGLPSYWEFGFLLPGFFDSLFFLSVRALFSGFRDGLLRKNKIRQIIATSLSLRHRLAGSLHVSGKLPTYPFSKPFCPKLMLA